MKRLPHILVVAIGFVLASNARGAPRDPVNSNWVPYREAQKHLIVVRGRGQPVYPEVWRRRKSDGHWEYKVELRSFPGNAEERSVAYDEYVGEIIAGIKTQAQGKAMFFIHGGMNFVSGSTKRAAELVGNNEERLRDYNLSALGYPIFICWDSPPTGYGEQVVWVRAGKTEKYERKFRDRAYAILTLPFYFLGDIGRGLTRFPAQLSQSAHNDTYAINPRLFTEFKAMRYETRYLRGEIPGPDGQYITGPRIEVSGPPKLPAGPSVFLADVQTALLFPIRNVTLPLIDSIGVGAWNNMLRHTETMFDRTNTSRVRRRSFVEQAVADYQTGAIAMFFSRLSRDEEGKNFQITLIGHSMGAIVANRIVNAYPELTYKNIVYLGAACSVRDFETCIVPYVSTHNTHFYGLSLHPRCEAGEIALSPGRLSLDVAPRGSLPIWIDNIFANPPVEGQRRLGIFQTAVLASHNIPLEQRPKFTLKCFTFGDARAENGLIRCPQHHADFSQAPYWNPAFWQIDDKPVTARKTRSRARAKIATVSNN